MQSNGNPKRRVAHPVAFTAPPSARFDRFTTNHSPGQHAQVAEAVPAKDPAPLLIDFSHGDVTAFEPPDWALPTYVAAFKDGANTAYSAYRGHREVREPLAERLSKLLQSPVDPHREVILTPGTQAGLFLGLSALVEVGNPVAIVQPDYFANQRIVRYLGGKIIPIALSYLHNDPATVDLDELRNAVTKSGAKVVCMSNPNNPTGCVFSAQTMEDISAICQEAGAFLVVDQLYCRLTYEPGSYANARSIAGMEHQSLTLVGPSKTESLSGFRLGVAIGPDWLIDRMEKLISIVSLRAPGYAQMLLNRWLSEDPEWLSQRITEHQSLRDRTVAQLRAIPGLRVRPTEGGSYLFPTLPTLSVTTDEFVQRLLNDGISLTRGDEFGNTSSQSFRINFSQHAEPMAQGIARLVTIANELILDGPSTLQ